MSLRSTECPWCNQASNDTASRVTVNAPCPPLLIFKAEYDKFDEDLTKGFIIDPEILVNGQSYTLLCTVYWERHHFWTSGTYNGEVWTGGTDFSAKFLCMGETKQLLRKRNESMPALMVYGKC